MTGKKKTTARKSPENVRAGGARAKPDAKGGKSIEQSPWHTANKLRGSVESSEYKHVVLSLISLKLSSDKFERGRADVQ